MRKYAPDTVDATMYFCPQPCKKRYVNSVLPDPIVNANERFKDTVKTAISCPAGIKLR